MAPRRSRQISIKDCYEILHVQKGADLQAVKTAYRKRAFELHPDLNPGDPEASRQFQLLNEAYVALSAILKPEEEARQKAAQTAEKEEKKETGEQKEEAQEKTASADREASRASAAYAEQDVLRDLLNDPFARRVFEDIYSELNRKEAGRQTETKAEPPTGEEKKKPPQREPQPAQARAIQARSPEKGVTGVVKDWLRKQIDEEQSLTMPASHLGPGAKIRLQIRKGISEELTAVDVRLPRDFVVGKPMRLKGLGKRVGPWQGDLYLTIYTV